MAGTLGSLLKVAHSAFTAPQGTTQGFCKVIKYGTLCRTVVWPLFPPLLLYQYIREKDKDLFATELFYAKSGSTDHKAFFDSSKPGIQGHWRIQQDMEIIRAGANA